MPSGGMELQAKGARRRKWNWNDSVTASDSFPKVYPLVLGVNYNCGIRIFSQQNMTLTFSAESRSCRFHVGTSIKVSTNIYLTLKTVRQLLTYQS